MIYNDILETIGNTPVIKIQKLAPEGVEIYVKLEAFNPMGSVKDRLALGIILDAEKRGVLKPGQTVIEATSGNTLTLPLGLTFGRTMALEGGRGLDLSIGAYHLTERPQDAPQWQLKFGISYFWP